MAGLITQAAWPRLVQKDLSLVFVNQYRDIPSMLPLLYRMKRAEQGTEYDLETGDIGVVPALSDTGIAYDTVQEGYRKSVTETEYALGIKVTRKLLRNDLYGVIKEKTKLLAQAFRHLRETRGAFAFNNAFNSSFTVGDTLSLCNSAHTSRYGGANQSNTSTLAFSAANLETNRIAMKKLKTNRDNPMVNIPTIILAPMDLEDKVYEVIKSMGKVDTAVNNRNYHEGRYNAIIWDNYLTSATAWFIINESMMKEKLVFRQLEPMQFFMSGEFDTLVSKYAGYCSFETSTVEWRWAFGANP